jgi:hypothetical protein
MRSLDDIPDPLDRVIAALPCWRHFLFGWFKKREQPARIARQGSLEQIERDDAPPGETEKMMEIQQLCWLAGISAETIARAKAEGRLEEEWAKFDLDRYKQFRAECIELADTITDEFYRAVVINYLVEVCMKAADIDDARALFEHQEIRSLQEDIVAKYPELVRPRISEIMLSGQSPRFPRAAAVHARTSLVRSPEACTRWRAVRPRERETNWACCPDGAQRDVRKCFHLSQRESAASKVQNRSRAAESLVLLDVKLHQAYCQLAAMMPAPDLVVTWRAPAILEGNL